MFDPRRVGHDLDLARRRYGGRNWPASFADRLTEPLPSFRDVAKLVWQDRSFRDPSVLGDPAGIPVTPRDALPRVDPGQSAVTWIGHATYAIQMAGMTIVTDPVWSGRIPGVRARLTPPGVPLEAIRRIDAVLISHNHYDHLDAPTVRRLSRSTPVLVPAMLGSWFRRRGFGQTIELDWWESVRLGDVTVEFVPAHHWSRRGMGDSCRTLWGGWVIRHADTTIWFVGDSGYGSRFAEIGARHPGIDLALMPIGAYQPRWFMKSSHVNPAEAVQACIDAGARRMATMHWGTFLLSGEPLLSPLRETIEAWQRAGRPREDLWDLPVGGSRIW